MKDWKFLQVGNAKTNNETIDPSDAELRKLEDELRGWLKMYDSKDPNVDKANVEKNIRAIRADIEKYKRKHKIWNESIFKQEASMFEGLKNDAEKEIGNEFATTPNTISIGDNVETLTGKKGNVVEKNGHILKIKLSDGSFEYEHEYKAKKVGNAQYGSKEDIISHLDTDLYEIHQRLKQKDESPWRYLSELQKKGYDMGTLSRHNKDIGKIIEKLKTGNAWTSADERRFDELNKKGPSKMTDAEWKEFQELNKRAYQADRKALKSIGNATGDEYNAEIQRLTKKAEQLRRMGQGKSAMEIEKQIEKLGKELSELGNKKAGNAFDAGIHLTIRYNGKEEEVKVLKDMPTSVVVKGQNGAVVEIKKVYLDVLKVHNEETKGERKFGKVMGEFEEGALKTPQGKTVTDPAQAKAIAYSEADKVDNLKRARNAMNKKVKNSSVREHKDSEGRIAQIDFNSDGTDADMSIYEDDRMTRAVDHKNFSTIRDAEQYVQSHGFRRVG